MQAVLLEDKDASVDMQESALHVICTLAYELSCLVSEKEERISALPSHEQNIENLEGLQAEIGELQIVGSYKVLEVLVSYMGGSSSIVALTPNCSLLYCSKYAKMSYIWTQSWPRAEMMLQVMNRLATLTPW